jgi:hypothetical protein
VDPSREVEECSPCRERMHNERTTVHLDAPAW